MSGSELGILGGILLALVTLIIKAFVPGKKNGNPGNPGNNLSTQMLIDLTTDIAEVKTGMSEIRRALQRIEDKLP